MNPSSHKNRAPETVPPSRIGKLGRPSFARVWLIRVGLAVAFLLCSPILEAQSQDAVSREVSIFNFGLPSASAEAISREVSVFNFGLPSANAEAISREVSVFNFGLPSAGTEAISREVSVYNYGVPPVNFAVGSTNIFGNETGQVPFSLQTVQDLTNLNLTLLADDSHLQLLSVTPASSEVLAATLGPPGVNSHPISFTLNPAAIPATNHTLAYLNFQGVTNLDTAIVPLTVTNLAGFCSNGQSAPGVAANGQVIVIVSRPILFPATSLPFGFTIFGVPGATYSIQATTNLAPADWIEVERLSESGLTLTVMDLMTGAPQQFYRVQQVGP